MNNQVFNFDFTKGQPGIFSERYASAKDVMENHSDGKFVVLVLNHFERRFFIARSNSIVNYLCTARDFMLGVTRYSAPVSLQAARNKENLPFWNVEILPAEGMSAELVRAKFEQLDAGWTEIGTRSHLIRTSSRNKKIIKITHIKSGWVRHSSHSLDTNLNYGYIASQALSILITKRVRINGVLDTSIKARTMDPLEKMYRDIQEDFDTDKESYTVEVIQELNSANHHTPIIEIVKDLNRKFQETWVERHAYWDIALAA